MNGKKLSKLNIIELPILPKVTWGLNAVSLKILIGPFIKLDTIISQSFIKIERV